MHVHIIIPCLASVKTKPFKKPGVVTQRYDCLLGTRSEWCKVDNFVNCVTFINLDDSQIKKAAARFVVWLRSALARWITGGRCHIFQGRNWTTASSLWHNKQEVTTALMNPFYQEKIDLLLLFTTQYHEPRWREKLTEKGEITRHYTAWRQSSLTGTIGFHKRRQVATPTPQTDRPSTQRRLKGVTCTFHEMRLLG